MESEDSALENFVVIIMGSIVACILAFIFGVLVSFFLKGVSKSADLLDKKNKGMKRKS